MSTPETIQLDYPIDVKSAGGGVMQVTSITLRRMKAKDLKHIKTGEMEEDPSAMFPLIAALADLPLESVEEMDMADLKKVIEKLMTFSAGFLGTGSKSSGESLQPITSLPEQSGT